MMMRNMETQRRLSLYIVPVLIGLGGVIYSQQLEDQFWRSIALIVSIALPLYAAGNLLARFRTSTIERFAMLSGVLMLILGAVFSISGLSDTLSQIRDVDESVINASRIIGMSSLFLGLFVVLFTVARTSEDIDEITERFRFLAEHISEGFILSKPDGEIRLVNQKALEMFGMEREQVIGRNARDLALALDVGNIVEQLDKRAEGIASEYEIVFQRDGQERIFLMNGAPVFNQQGRHTLTMATILDITEQRQLTRRVEQYARNLRELVDEQTRKLHQSEERLRQLLLSMNEGFLTVDLDHKIRFANAQAQAMLKTGEKALYGRSIFDYVAGSDRYRLLHLFARAVEEQPGKGLRHEIELLDSNGAGQPTVVGMAYLNAPEAQERGYSLVITPVADLKRMQQQLLLRARDLERANEELRLHDRAKDSFLSNVSHELRTPLTTIQGYIELFAENTLGEVTEAQRNALDIMERNANHLLTHINEMIEFSRMQIRGIQIVSDLYDASALAREAAAAIHPSALEKDITVHLDTPDAALYCWGDRDKLNQTLDILLNNAVKFTGKGGDITVRVFPENQRDVAFTVNDTGIGIAREHHQKIFKRFFQVDSSKTRQYEGTGIGLAIAHNIVQTHGGEITVDSEPGKGATFIVRLPGLVFDNHMGSGDSEEIEPQRILLISENEECRQALLSFPPLINSPVVVAQNGYQAVRQMDTDKIDLVVISDTPSDVAGEATIRIVRKQPATRSAPIIVLTNEGGNVIHSLGEVQDNIHFVFKPFTAETIIEKIRQITDGAPISVETKALEELYQAPKRKPFALVLDSDPSFLEWIETALPYYNIDCRGVKSPAEGIEIAHAFRPDVLFIDADTPPVLGDAAIALFKADDITRNVPIYVMSGMSIAALASTDKNGVEGILRKPFPISEMMEIISERAGK